ncbi:MAG: energy transducer TonB, partial [Sphingomonas parapaucimobilis]
MAYTDQKMSGGKVVAIVIVVLIHAALGYAFVTGLAYQYVKKATEKLNTFDVQEPPPPPPPEEPPPPPPPEQPNVPPPPTTVVTPPPIVNVPT